MVYGAALLSLQDHRRRTTAYRGFQGHQIFHDSGENEVLDESTSFGLNVENDRAGAG